eukprot:8889429-Pyramimonas_sp.AAC.1
MPNWCHRIAACVTKDRGTPVASKTCSSVARPLSVVESQMTGTRSLLQVMLLGMLSFATWARISRISCGSRRALPSLSGGGRVRVFCWCPSVVRA